MKKCYVIVMLKLIPSIRFSLYRGGDEDSFKVK